MARRIAALENHPTRMPEAPDFFPRHCLGRGHTDHRDIRFRNFSFPSVKLVVYPDPNDASIDWLSKDGLNECARCF
jgi:hypothetical protein